jgi:hypothetical protein
VAVKKGWKPISKSKSGLIISIKPAVIKSTQKPVASLPEKAAKYKIPAIIPTLTIGGLKPAKKQ